MLSKRLAGLSALIVEDEALIAMACADILNAAHCKVLGCVATAEAAVNSALNYTPDFVLMDVRLRGEKTGIDAAEELRAQGATFPILFVTAFSQPDATRRMRRIARSGILPKPLDYAQLGSVIHDLNRQ